MIPSPLEIIGFRYLEKNELFISLIPLVEVIKVLYLKNNFRKLYQKSLVMGNGDLIISYCRIYFQQLVDIMRVILFWKCKTIVYERF